MSDQERAITEDGPTQRVFAWHPTYKGKAVDDVTAEIEDALIGDQQSYHITIDGPEEQEEAMLVRVLELEKRWGPYAMDWYNADARALAARIATFEWDREQRQELFPYGEYRLSAAPLPTAAPPPDEDDDRPSRPWWKFW